MVVPSILLATYIVLNVRAQTATVQQTASAAPSGWWSGLEDYGTYHSRYLSLDCEDKHNTTFFQSCCHPRLKNETTSSVPAECTSNSTSSSWSTGTMTLAPLSALPSGGNTDGDDDNDEECESDDSEDDTTSTTAPGSNDDDDDDEECEADDSSTSEESSTGTQQQGSFGFGSGTAQTLAATSKASDSQSSASVTSKASSSQTSASATQSASASSNSSGSEQVNTGGYATYFTQNNQAGACGTVHSDSDLICAMDERRYGNSGEKSSLCGKQVHIKNTKNGKTVTVTVADDCPTCENENSIDLSVGAFTQIATEEEGMVPIEWYFVS